MLPPFDSAGMALFLDIDGTIAEIAPRPEDAVIAPPMLETLSALFARMGGALALVSGRDLAMIDRLCAPHRFPVAAQHGLELRCVAGSHDVADGREAMRAVEARIAAFHKDHPQLLIEYKGLATAVHYRGAPGLQSELRDFMRALARREAEMELLEGKMVCEIRLKGGDKGMAIRRFMAMPEFSGRMPVFLGDDVTDEDGFHAVNALRGISVKIGAGETAARYRLEGVRDVASWLGAAPSLAAEEAA